jgi:prophage antirepressor-like protein
MFEGNQVTIIQPTTDNTHSFLFLANDIAKILEIVNIRSSIQNYDETERCRGVAGCIVPHIPWTLYTSVCQ